ncbi:MAG: hypothetical protein MUF71_15040 [Candidatus Kapabacteria bacterium]|jgi:hypothetical protein|nr:hypothetical protein [Candidatus Kapabacteria bacterium]
MEAMTQGEMDVLFDNPSSSKSVMVRLSQEQAARMEAVKYAAVEEQESVYQVILQEVKPELERLQRLRAEEK